MHKVILKTLIDEDQIVIKKYKYLVKGSILKQQILNAKTKTY
jgi:hypothetical protein